MKIFKHTFLMLFAFPLMVFSRIGETEAQLKGRFGEPLFNEEGQIGFKKDDFGISFLIIDGKAESMTVGNKQRKITDEEIRKLLKNNSSGSEWELRITTNDGKLWENPEKWVAVYSIEKNVLLIRSKKAADSRPDIFKPMESELLKGF